MDGSGWSQAMQGRFATLLRGYDPVSHISIWSVLRPNTGRYHKSRVLRYATATTTGEVRFHSDQPESKILCRGAQVASDDYVRRWQVVARNGCDSQRQWAEHLDRRNLQRHAGQALDRPAGADGSLNGPKPVLIPVPSRNRWRLECNSTAITLCTHFLYYSLHFSE